MINRQPGATLIVRLHARVKWGRSLQPCSGAAYSSVRFHNSHLLINPASAVAVAYP